MGIVIYSLWSGCSWIGCPGLSSALNKPHRGQDVHCSWSTESKDLLLQLDPGENSAQQQQRAQPHFYPLTCQTWERHTFSSRELSHPHSPLKFVSYKPMLLPEPFSGVNKHLGITPIPSVSCYRVPNQRDCDAFLQQWPGPDSLLLLLAPEPLPPAGAVPPAHGSHQQLGPLLLL